MIAMLDEKIILEDIDEPFQTLENSIKGTDMGPSDIRRLYLQGKSTDEIIKIIENGKKNIQAR